jgi:hypothetical protein
MKNERNEKNYKNQEIADYVIRQYERLQEKQMPMHSLWHEIALYTRASSNNSDVAKKVFDTTAISASEQLTSGLWSLINSASLRWFMIKPKNKDNLLIKEYKDWFDEVTQVMYEALEDPKSGFYYKSYEYYADLVSFGTAIMFLGENTKDQKITHQVMNLKDIYFSNQTDEIDLLIRRIFLSAKQAVARFGLQNVCEKIRKAYYQGSSETFLILHMVTKEDAYPIDGYNYKNMPYVGHYVCRESKKWIAKNGYYEFPYVISRWQTAANDVYGKSPAMEALPDVRMLNAISKSIITATQMQINPTLLATNEVSIHGLKVAPGGVIHGGIDPISGNQLVKPLELNGDMSSSYNLQNQRRENIKEIFYGNLLSFMYQKNATATEVVSVNDQRLRLLGAKVSRIQSEFLYPVLKRQYAILKRLKKLPKKPQFLDIDDIEIEFCGLWNRNQTLLDNFGLQQIVQMIAFVKEFEPEITKTINWQGVIELLAKGQGLPENLLNKGVR